MNPNLKVAIEAAIKAGTAILNIYAQDFTVDTKADASPLTQADKNANEVINSFLEPTGIPIISEENKQTDYAIRRTWARCWVVDPLDGTKEFIKRNGEFTVNIALVENGRPVLGVIYVPATMELYFAQVYSRNAFKIIVSDENQSAAELIASATEIRPAEAPQHKIQVVGSRSHMSEETLAFMEELKKKHPVAEIVSKGSSLKFCLVAEGKAHVYPRFAPTMEWDTAAGQAICEAVGLKVINKETNAELRYNKENLLNPFFLVSR